MDIRTEKLIDDLGSVHSALAAEAAGRRDAGESYEMILSYFKDLFDRATILRESETA